MTRLGLVATLVVLLAEAAAAQPTANIGTNPPGSVLYVVGTRWPRWRPRPAPPG